MSEIKRYDELPKDVIKGHDANWKIDGINGDWRELTDPNWTTIVHTAVMKENGDIAFDKINIIGAGSYVIPIRINPKGKAEFLLIKERRLLLRDPSGKQGNVLIENIISGGLNQGETHAQAAERETIEECGYHPIGLAEIGSIYLDPSNSESTYSFFLALIPYKQISEDTSEDEGELIDSHKWSAISELKKMNLRDGKTLIGLSLAEKVIRPELI